LWAFTIRSKESVSGTCVAVSHWETNCREAGGCSDFPNASRLMPFDILNTRIAFGSNFFIPYSLLDVLIADYYGNNHLSRKK
jgi:hypothetical protein